MSIAQVQALRAIIAGRPQVSETLDARRNGFELFAQRFPCLPGVAAERVALPGGLSALWVTPESAAPGRAILYLHGGAFVVGSAASHAGLAGRIASAAGVRALVLDYRRAPEHPFPAALEDAAAAYAWLQDQGMGRIALAGDSAGGNLAASLAVTHHPACVALLSPYLDLTHSGESVRTRAARDWFIDTAGMDRTASLYHAATPPSDPRVSPLFADLSGFPPVYVQVGEDEVLYDDALRFAERVRAVGGHAVFDPWPDMFHVFPFFAAALDEGAQGAERAGRFIADQIG